MPLLYAWRACKPYTVRLAMHTCDTRTEPLVGLKSAPWSCHCPCSEVFLGSWCYRVLDAPLMGWGMVPSLFLGVRVFLGVSTWACRAFSAFVYRVAADRAKYRIGGWGVTMVSAIPTPFSLSTA